MQERLRNVIKWFFIILGILFLIQMFILSGILIGFKTADKSSLSFGGNTPKEMKEVVKYISEYRNEHSKFPDNLEGFKGKRGFDYSYKLSDKNNCYTVTITGKDSVKSYKYCIYTDKNENASTQSYSEMRN